MTRRPLLEKVARAICRASGANPDQPVYANGNPEDGVLYLKWCLYRAEAKAAIDACQIERTLKVLVEADLKLARDYPDDQEARIVRERIAGLLEKLEGGT